MKNWPFWMFLLAIITGICVDVQRDAYRLVYSHDNIADDSRRLFPV